MWNRLFRHPLPHLSLPLPTEPGLYLIYEHSDKGDYKNQQLTIYKGTLLVKVIVYVSVCQHSTATLLLQKTQPRKLSSTHINTNNTYNNLILAQWFSIFLSTRTP